MSQFLSSTDEFMWRVGMDPRLRSTIAALVLLDGCPDWNSMVDRFDRLSKAVPRFRQRVVRPTRLVPPRWEVDPDFDLGFHLRRASIPPPGTHDSLLQQVELAVTTDYDRNHPLWEATLFERPSDTGAALLCKLDHALTDGVGAVGLASILYDHQPTSVSDACAPDDSTHVDHERHESGPLGAIADVVEFGTTSATAAVAGMVRAAPRLGRLVRNPIATCAAVRDTAASVYRTVRPLGGPRSMITQGRSTNRRVDTYEVSAVALRSAGHCAGGSLNDAFVAAVIAGVRRYHQAHHAPLDNLVLSMPISVRTATDHLAGNLASLIRLEVPAQTCDPAALIRDIHERTTAARHEESLSYVSLIAGALNLMPHAYVGSALRQVDFIASDVPGFPAPVSIAGVPVRMHYAFSPTMGAAVNVTLLTYADACGLGITADHRAIPDLGVFRDCLAAGFAETVALAS